ncbi:histidine-rich glycoprotein [Drosophila innubila]|uniref:histidine-rich glycoprotein n=1 Tax=Drosophila innubila TaxID=198719 RepID=UPI00148DFD5F|nr:histidine-rich glycoprotein [Drosophila innubila]
MSKAVFIIATILISVVLASQAIEDNHRSHKQHKRQHSPSVGHHNGHPAEHAKHHIQDLNKEKINHGQMPVPLAPHHSKSQRNGRRHKTSKSSKLSKNHHHQQSKPSHHKVHQSHKTHGQGRKHH